jgi:predicted N-acetyltransferase YhbS
MTAAAVPEPVIVLAQERPQDAPSVEGLLDRAFGPERRAKTAERLREGRAPLRDLSFVAWSDDRIVACVRQWPVTIGGVPAVLLGPFAVEAAFRRQGLGARLIRHARDAARAAGHALIILVGDEPFFGPLGFSAAPAREARLPGPVDQNRVLIAELVPGAAANLAGPVLPAEV